MQRRKTLKNGLQNAKLFGKEEIQELYQVCNLPENCRGENLSLEQFAQIANYYTSHQKKIRKKGEDMNQIIVTEKIYVTPELRRKKKIYKIQFALSVFS